MEIQRYVPAIHPKQYVFGESEPYMKPDDEGRYISYEDHLKALQALKDSQGYFDRV